MKVLGHVVILASVLSVIVHVICAPNKACLAAFPQISEVEVQLGKTAILPCNSLATERGELDVHWEAMGKVVAFFQNGQLVAGLGYEGRVELQISEALEGDFSLTLRSVVMSDTDLYECLWQGRKSLSTVTLIVLPPLYPETHTVNEGVEVILPCFGKIPKNKPWEKMFIQWLKDDKEILLLSSGKISKNDRDLALLPKESISQGILSLVIRSVKASDQGIYKCLYKEKDYEAPRSGLPETTSLKVIAFLKPGDIPPESNSVTTVGRPRTSTLLFGLINDTSEDNSTVQGTVQELLIQPGTSNEYIGLLAEAMPESTTMHNTMRVTSEIIPLASMMADLNGLIADASTTVQDTAEAEPVIQPGTSNEYNGLLAEALSESTTIHNTVRAISEIIPLASMITDLSGLIASADSTTVQNTVEVSSELQPFTSGEYIGLNAEASLDNTTVQDTVGGVSEVLPLSSMTTNLNGLIAGDSGGSTTVQDTVEGTTVQDTIEEISELLPQPATTPDNIGLIPDSTVLYAVGDEESLFDKEIIHEEKVPWVRIGIISGVLLVTTAILGTLVALGKL